MESLEENVEKIGVMPFMLLDVNERYNPKYLRSLHPDGGTIYVLDFNLDDEGCLKERIFGANGEVLGWFYPDFNLINLDHHSDHIQFEAAVSTAIQCNIFNQSRNRQNKSNELAILSHTDCDSILSLVALSNPNLHFQFKIAFAHAVISADHMGNENLIADVLQSIEKLRDVNQSVEVLKSLLSGKSISDLPTDIQERYAVRKGQREIAQAMVQEGLFSHAGSGVYFVESEKSIPTEIFPQYFNQAGINAKVILIGSKSPDYVGKYKIAVRAGLALPSEVSLLKISDELSLRKFGFGGRNRAGNTGRNLAKADNISIEDFAKLVSTSKYLSEVG